MNVPFVRVDGVDYNPIAVEGIRDEMIRLRNGALDQDAFSEAIALSWCIAYLAEFADRLRLERE